MENFETKCMNIPCDFVKPQKLPIVNGVLDPNYNYAICKCCVDTSYGLIFPKDHRKEINFKCIKCGTEGTLIVKEVSE